MGKPTKKSRKHLKGGIGRGVVKKKSFLENQKKHKKKLIVAVKDPSIVKDETRFRFENFSSQVSSIEGSLVYQLAGRGNIRVGKLNIWVLLLFYIFICKYTLIFVG